MKKLRNKKLDMHEISISADKVLALTDNERWAYYLMGYITNELNIIVKLLAQTLNKQPDDRAFTHTADMIQSSMLFRLAAGKCHEAMLQLRSKQFRNVFTNVIAKHCPTANAEWRNLNSKFNSAAWLGKIRNGVIFHYPSPSEWCEITKPDEHWKDDKFYFSKALWSNFSEGSEIIALFWTCVTIANGNQPATKDEATKLYDHLVTTTIDILNLMINFLNMSLTVFIDDHMFSGNTPVKNLGTVNCVKASSVKIPFWLYME